MKARLGTVLLALLLLTAVTPAVANNITKVEINPTCDGFTLTFYGYDFVDSDVRDVNWLVHRYVNNGPAEQMLGHTLITTADADAAGNVQLAVPVPWAVPAGAHVEYVTTYLLKGGPEYGSRWWIDVTQQTDVFSWTGPATFDCPEQHHGPEICRTPGYWGTHANVVSSLLGIFHPVVCGVTLDTVATNDRTSTEEAVCVSPQGDQTLQLARQLTSAALSCIASGAPGCTGLTVEAVFDQCNQVCTDGAPVPGVQNCIDRLDCWNNGGLWDPATNFCQMGTCSDTGLPCDTNDVCGTATCQPLPGNCHSTPLPQDQPANSSRQCNDAIKNSCTIFSAPSLTCQ